MTVREKAQEYYDSLGIKPYNDEVSFAIYEAGVAQYGFKKFDYEVTKMVKRK